MRRLATGLALLLLGGFRAPPPPLTVFAAASLTAAFNEMADTLRHRQPGLHIDINFAGSQALALQIEQGAPADVFASADERWMAAVRDSGLVDGTSETFARNRLVVIVPRSNRAHISRLADLTHPGVKLVLAADAVPVGRYARNALAELEHVPGFSAGYSARVLANVVSNEDNVKAVAAKVELDEADAGIVYVSDVTPAVAARVIRIAFPDAASVTATYPIAVLRHAPNHAAAQAFVELALSPTGQAILARNGFLPRGGTR